MILATSFWVTSLMQEQSSASVSETTLENVGKLLIRTYTSWYYNHNKTKPCPMSKSMSNDTIFPICWAMSWLVNTYPVELPLSLTSTIIYRMLPSLWFVDSHFLTHRKSISYTKRFLFPYHIFDLWRTRIHLATQIYTFIACQKTWCVTNIICRLKGSWRIAKVMYRGTNLVCIRQETYSINNGMYQVSKRWGALKRNRVSNQLYRVLYLGYINSKWVV